ncbi:MAG: DUF373 family protein [Candidatus Lokiarchaeota archaeon]|nr:DUF373 family protein [Candidatus Lokiarchaeota archaeon]
MKTLILCVDRDDDLGEKAKVTSPVIGRKNNLKAVVSLGMEDPEDSDANVIFMGLKLFKKYEEMGREMEIATICGDKMVGVQSDANLIRQFYAVLENFSPDTVVLVSDGAEDEVILPLISQRVQIEHIARVVVKQQQNLESTYYIIMSAFKNPKIGKKIIVPLAGLLMVWGILMLMGYSSLAIGGLVILLAGFVMIKALNIEDQISRTMDDLREALRTRRYLLFSSIFLSLMLILIGFVVSFQKARVEDALGHFLFRFLDSVWLFLIISALIYTVGNTLDTYVRTNKFIRSTGVILLSLAALGFISNTTFSFLGFALFDAEIDLMENLISLTVGVTLLLASVMVYTYNKNKKHGRRRAGWLR